MAVASAAELAASYAPELDVVGTWAGAPPADLTELLPYADGSVGVGIVGYFLNGLIGAYPETAPAIHDKLTIYGEDLLDKTQHQCANETLLTYAFHHLHEYFTENPQQLISEEPVEEPLRPAAHRPLQTQRPGVNRQQPLRPAGALDRGQPAGPRLVRPRRRRAILDQRTAALPQQNGVQPLPDLLGRRRTRHAMDRRPRQRPTHYPQLRTVSKTASPDRRDDGVGPTAHRPRQPPVFACE